MSLQIWLVLMETFSGLWGMKNKTVLNMWQEIHVDVRSVTWQKNAVPAVKEKVNI